MDYSKKKTTRRALVARAPAAKKQAKKKCSTALITANKELAYQQKEKSYRATALAAANKELNFQQSEQKLRTAELLLANKELAYQYKEKGNRAAELAVANKELVYQQSEKKDRAAELVIANKELAYQHKEKGNRAAELAVANKELAFQNKEKEKRAAELVIANKELAYQNKEKEKRAAELLVAVLELQESETRYSNLFHQSPQPRWVYNPKTLRCLQVNQAAVNCYGYTEQEFLRINIHELETGKHENNKRKNGKDRHTFAGRQRHYRKSGEPVEADVYCNPIIINDTPYISVLSIDVTEKILYEHKFSRAIIKTQENERYEIGAELHDNVCQILASTLMSFRLLKNSLSPDGMEIFKRSQDYILLASEEIRNLSHRLAPAFFPESTLEEAFDRVLHEFNADNKFALLLYFDKAVAKVKITMDLQLNLYRILQEQLSNILKYARATQIKVDVVIHREKIKMQVTDNGRGFNTDDVKDGIGIANMKRRAELFSGKLDIVSSRNKGCELTVEVPLQGNAEVA